MRSEINLNRSNPVTLADLPPLGYADVICYADIKTEIGFDVYVVVVELQHMIDPHCHPKMN